MKNTAPYSFIRTFLLGLMILPATVSQAAVLLSWEVANWNDPWETTSTDANLDASEWIPSPDAVSDIHLNDSGKFRFFSTSNSADAFNADDYFEFTVNPKPGVSYSVDSLNVFGGIGKNEITLELRSSLDSYATVLDDNNVTTGSGDIVRTWTIPGTDHNDLTAGATFRLYGFGTGHTLNVKSDPVEGDGFWLEGTVSVIPEPASVVLILIMGSALVVTGVRRRQ